MLADVAHISGLEYPVFAYLLLHVEQKDLAVCGPVRELVRIGVGRRNRGDDTRATGGAHRVGPADGGHTRSPIARCIGDAPGQVARHVEAGVGDVMVVVNAIARADHHGGER